MNAKVAFVLRLLDDFSGKVIQREPFRFTSEGLKLHPVVKEEGLYVFLEPQPEQISIEIFGSNYFDTAVLVRKGELNPVEPVADVRLFGRPGKSFPYRAELLCGAWEDKKAVFPSVVCAKKAKPTGLVLKEMKKTGNDIYLQFSGFTKENLMGKTYLLGNSKNAEVFIIIEKRGINEYRVEGDFAKKHSAGEELHRAYRSVTDVKGGYAIPVESRDDEFISEVMLLQHKSLSS